MGTVKSRSQKRVGWVPFTARWSFRMHTHNRQSTGESPAPKVASRIPHAELGM